MAEHVVPHFHNDPGVPVIESVAKEFMCVGATPPFDHPHMFLDIGEDKEIICPYCSTLYRYNSALDPHAARPPECAAASVRRRLTCIGISDHGATASCHHRRSRHRRIDGRAGACARRRPRDRL